MFWTCSGHYKVHVHGRDSPGRPVYGHCPVPLPVLVGTMHKRTKIGCEKLLQDAIDSCPVPAIKNYIKIYSDCYSFLFLKDYIKIYSDHCFLQITLIYSDHCF